MGGIYRIIDYRWPPIAIQVGLSQLGVDRCVLPEYRTGVTKDARVRADDVPPAFRILMELIEYRARRADMKKPS